MLIGIIVGLLIGLAVAIPAVLIAIALRPREPHDPFFHPFGEVPAPPGLFTRGDAFGDGDLAELTGGDQ
jgi:hypothetical protein